LWPRSPISATAEFLYTVMGGTRWVEPIPANLHRSATASDNEIGV